MLLDFFTSEVFMKYAVLFSILISPLAFAEGEAVAPAAPKTGETVSLSAEATAPLFERVRGAHIRAQQNGKVVAMSKATSAK
jgi:hypothetical protein